MPRSPRAVITAGALTATALLAACGAPGYGTCQPRFQGTASQFKARTGYSCIFFGTPDEVAAWRTMLIGGEVVAYSGTCDDPSPVFELYGEQPPGTPSADTCARRYP